VPPLSCKGNEKENELMKKNQAEKFQLRRRGKIVALNIGVSTDGEGEEVLKKLSAFLNSLKDEPGFKTFGIEFSEEMIDG
jgi:hypothetical protein